MSRANQYSPEVRERAVRMVLEHEGEYSSQWQAIQSIAAKIGCSPDSLKAWLKRSQIAPSTYYDHKAKQRQPEKRSARAKRDEVLTLDIQRIWEENFRVYGVRKVWRQLTREDIRIA